MLPFINQRANVAECLNFFFFLLHTYSLEIIHAEEQRGLDIAMGGIFLKA